MGFEKGGVTEETPNLRSNSSSYCLSKTVNLYHFQSSRKRNSKVARMESTAPNAGAASQKEWEMRGETKHR